MWKVKGQDLDWIDMTWRYFQRIAYFDNFFDRPRWLNIRWDHSTSFESLGTRKTLQSQFGWSAALDPFRILRFGSLMKQKSGWLLSFSDWGGHLYPSLFGHCAQCSCFCISPPKVVLYPNKHTWVHIQTSNMAKPPCTPSVAFGQMSQNVFGLMSLNISLFLKSSDGLP